MFFYIWWKKSEICWLKSERHRTMDVNLLFRREGVGHFQAMIIEMERTSKNLVCDMAKIQQQKKNSHNISTRTVRSAGGTSFVLDAWHTYVVLSASRLICEISKRLTVTWRPIDTPPPVLIGVVPLNHVTWGSGRPVIKKKLQKINFKKKSRVLKVKIRQFAENLKSKYQKHH